MARKGRPWTPVDVESVKELQKIREEDGRDLSLRAIGAATGISHGRIGDLFKFTNGAPSLYEFTSLCLLFNKRPSTVLEHVMQTLEHQQPTTHKTTALADARRVELEETARRESDLAAATLKTLEEDPMQLAAYADGHKHDEDPDNIA